VHFSSEVEITAEQWAHWLLLWKW